MYFKWVTESKLWIIFKLYQKTLECKGTNTGNILNSVSVSLSCSFVWVCRSCNFAAHNAAKLALNSALPLCFNKENLPKVILSTCVVDFHVVVSSFSYEWQWSLAKKKKNKQTQGREKNADNNKRKKHREREEKMQKQQSANMQREKGWARLRRRIRRNLGAISRSKVEASTMAEPVSTRLTLC